MIKAAIIFGASPGVGGLGAQVANAIEVVAAEGVELHALGPAPQPGRFDELTRGRIIWKSAPAIVAPWRVKYSRLRWRAGDLVFRTSRGIGEWAHGEIERIRPDRIYAFTQVGLESLEWASRSGVDSILESPNGHIANFAEVYRRESSDFCGRTYRGHPNQMMVERVEREYSLASRIRLSSDWSRRTFAREPALAGKIAVFDQPIDLQRFRPSTEQPEFSGPLRVCFVGMLDLRKGFVYLLRAIRKVGAERIKLRIVGATGDADSRMLFMRESAGLDVSASTGDPIDAMRNSELLVLPTLEDGSPFAVAEAMACGLPVIVTDQCGGAEWVREGESGWIVPARDSDALARALERAIRVRAHLREMGASARRDTERRAGPECVFALRRWIYSRAAGV